MITPPSSQLPGLGGLVATIRDDIAAGRGDRTAPGVRTVAVHRLGVWRMSIDNKVLRAPLSVFYRMLFRFCRNIYGIELPYSVQLGKYVVFEHQGGIVVHGDAVIGDGCVIRQGVTIGNRVADQALSAPTLGSNVNVGAGAVIVGGITIGDDASIGANAVVLHDVPAGATVVGIPAQPIERRAPKAA